MSENICVAIRIRPKNKKETDTKLVTTKTSIQLHDSIFHFDSVFNSVNQQTIYDLSKNAVDWVCQGYNATIFVYGATSSGKSYTMFGTDQEQGITPRACRDMFDMIEKKDNVKEANLKISFVEIYLENFRDLLNNSKKEIKIRQSDKGVYLQGITEKFVNNYEEIITCLKQGFTYRATATTALNSQSSRSHAILSLYLCQTLTDNSQVTSKLHLIDLAGSENVERSEVQGVSLTEAQKINKSLSALGNVIYALTEKNREHIPYRDSKLTMLLQDSLGGNAKTILIATVSPAESCYSETLNTLKFAYRAKNITNAPRINRSESATILQDTIVNLNKRIVELENELSDNQKIIYLQQNMDDPNTEILTIRIERLEYKIKSLEEELSVQLTQYKELYNIFIQQRQLAKNIAKQLYEEKIKCSHMKTEIEQHRDVLVGLKNCHSHNIVSEIIQHTAIKPFELQLLDNKFDIDVDDVELYSPQLK